MTSATHTHLGGITVTFPYDQIDFLACWLLASLLSTFFLLNMDSLLAFCALALSPAIFLSLTVLFLLLNSGISCPFLVVVYGGLQHE
jgi:hypothetical protein